MEQSSSWEANSHLTSREITSFLRNPEVPYCVHSIPPLVPNLSQMNPVYIFPPYFPKIHSDMIFLPTPTSTEWSLTFKVFR
jgi:hypothetical protein